MWWHCPWLLPFCSAITKFEIQEQATQTISSPVSYDNIFLKFDKKCLEDLDIWNHLRSVTLEDDGQRVFNDANAIGDDQLYKFLNENLAHTKATLKIRHSSLGFTPMANDAAVGRRLAEASGVKYEVYDKERELLASLHMLASSALVGVDKAKELLSLEQSGDAQKLFDFISLSDRFGLLDEPGSPPDSSSAVTMNHQIAEYNTLDFFGMHVVRNPYLKQNFHKLAKKLPCLEFEPEPDLVKQPLGSFDWSTYRAVEVDEPIEGVEPQDLPVPADEPSAQMRGRQLQGVTTPSEGEAPATPAKQEETPPRTISPQNGPSPPKGPSPPEGPPPPNGPSLQNAASPPKLSTVARESLLESGGSGEVVTLLPDPSGNKSAYEQPSDYNAAPASASGPVEQGASAKLANNMEFVLPSDPFFKDQWYLKGPEQNQPFGAQVVSGWGNLADALKGGGTKSGAFDDILKTAGGMTVAVLDSGCSQNADLTSQFWTNPDNPGCKKTGSQPQPITTGEGGLGTECVGFDFSTMTSDPTQELVGRIHGSSTAGLIAAEGNNGIGIVGICPMCKIMCLKIYNSKTKQIASSSVVAALDYVGRHKIRISNHSYGGFGNSNAELFAHRKLSDAGHLSVTSVGNNGCNIDLTEPGRPAPEGQCKELGSGDPLQHFTPASYDVPGIVAVGACTRRGGRASYSNWGVKSVDLFAPGDSMLTLHGKTQLAVVSGTSYATPIVTGIAALIWAQRPEMTNVQVKDLLMRSGLRVDALQGLAKEGRVVALNRALTFNGDGSFDELTKALTGDEDGTPALRPLNPRILLLPLFLLFRAAL